MHPTRARQDSDGNINGGSDTGERVSTEDYVKNFTKRAQEIRSEIHDLVNKNSSLLNRGLELASVVTDEKQTNSYAVIRIDSLDLNTTNKKNEDIKHKISDINQRLLELNNELANLHEEIISSIENVRERFGKQQDFINIAAHEIRSPCQAIIGFIELLKLEPVNSKKYLDLMSMNAERLSLLISNILDASRIDNKTLTLKKQKFNLVELLEQIIDDLNSRITTDLNQNTKIVFESIKTEIQKTNDTKEEEVYKSMVINADKGRLTQVIFNLLDNAIRLGKGNKIMVTLRTIIPILHDDIKNISSFESKEHIHSPDQQQKQREIIVQVKDTGRGIDLKIMDDLFSKFTSDSTTGGTGLGLFISKNIIEAHGGKIWAENNKDQKGATFSFSLPMHSK
jgi:signal transduction histidine kinase